MSNASSSSLVQEVWFSAVILTLPVYNLYVTQKICAGSLSAGLCPCLVSQDHLPPRPIHSTTCKPSQGLPCCEFEKLPQVCGCLGGAEGEHGWEEGEHVLLLSWTPSCADSSFISQVFPASWRIGTEAFRRVSQQPKSCPCLLPPPSRD